MRPSRRSPGRTHLAEKFEAIPMGQLGKCKLGSRPRSAGWSCILAELRLWL